MAALGRWDYRLRLMVDCLIAIMLVVVLAGMVLSHRRRARELQQTVLAQQALSRVKDQMAYRTALGQLDDQENAEHPPTMIAHPPTISPLWFPGDLPLNLLVPGRQPWIDVAPPDDLDYHPPDPYISGPNQAGFWYNPNSGVVRARVPKQFTDRATLELYNRVNNTYLESFPLKDSRRHTFPLPAATMLEDPTEILFGSDPSNPKKPQSNRGRAQTGSKQSLANPAGHVRPSHHPSPTQQADALEE